ncbi:MAG TPA: glycosyltransferase [Kiritimatiellia bacterium]|nr:glycosyltransferase [Kiritimatiellia bacterium]
MPHRLSIIAVTFNEVRHVGDLQAAIDRLARPAFIEVESILVDGGSRDGTVDAARAAGFSKIEILPGASIPACRNAGLRAADGDWIAFLDGDCEPAVDWLEQAAYFLEREPAAILGWPAEPPRPMTWVQSAWRFHWEQKNPTRSERHGRPVVEREGFRLVTTRNMLLHRAVAEQLGGFNEELTTGEDTDFAFRADQAGIPVLGIPALHVAHRGEPATLNAWFKQQLWHANRKSYTHIARLSGGRVGGNAPRFTALYAATLAFALLGLIGSLITEHWSLVTGTLPWLTLIAGPAALLSLRGRTARHFPALCVLYAAYGLARTIDLVGLHPTKPSWKTPAAGTGR